MASASDQHLCNGIPVDHRLKRFLPSAKQKHSRDIGKHVDIIEAFGNTFTRDNKSSPTKHETGFAAWLAKPDMMGGLVIALQQPAKSQVFTADVEWVRDECPSLAYLNRSLDFVDGPGGLRTTSVFDAFPFITEQISSPVLSDEAERAHNTFISMLEAKKPEVLFACWRIQNLRNLSFSGKGPGKANKVENVSLPSGHVIRVVNGFHPSYVANYCPNESCFRRLFTMELCKALCELNDAWQEEDWMVEMRSACKRKTHELWTAKDEDGEQLNQQTTRELRGTRANKTAQKYKAYTKSFDNGLDKIKHLFTYMTSPVYATESSWEFYNYNVTDQNISEGICDVLLAVSESMRQLSPDASMPEPALINLGKHISDRAFKFVRQDIPEVSKHQQGLQKDLWHSTFSDSTSRGLKDSIEKITARFFEDLTKSFTEPSTGWTYDPIFLHNAFKDLAVAYEDALGKEYDEHETSATGSVAEGVASLNTNLHTLSIAGSQSGHSAASAPNAVTPSRSHNNGCFVCGQSGHRYTECPLDKQGSTTPPATPSKPRCVTCRSSGHGADDCPSRNRGYMTPPRSSVSPPSGMRPTPRDSQLPSSTSARSATRSIMTPPKTPANSECYRCKQIGHWSNNCPQSRQSSASPSRSGPGNKCYSCREVGHWSIDCPKRKNK